MHNAQRESIERMPPRTEYLAVSIWPVILLWRCCNGHLGHLTTHDVVTWTHNAAVTGHYAGLCSTLQGSLIDIILVTEFSWREFERERHISGGRAELSRDYRANINNLWPTSDPSIVPPPAPGHHWHYVTLPGQWGAQLCRDSLTRVSRTNR